MRWRVVVGFMCFVLLAGVVGAGAWGVDHYVIRPAAKNASGSVPDPSIQEVAGGPSIEFHPTTVPKTSTTKPAPKVAANSSLLAATAALAKVTPAQQRDVVATGSAFAAASWDQYGHIDFWAYGGGKWTTAASRYYPPDAGEGSAAYSSTAGVQVKGQVLAGMSEPIFIVSGPFGYSQAANDLAYAYGSAGWGVLVPGSGNQLVSNGSSLTYQGPGLEWGEQFVAGHFETLQLPTDLGATLDPLFPVAEQWAWQGGALSLVSSNVVTAQLESAPVASAPPLRSGDPRRDGLYAGRIVAATTIGTSTYPLLRLQIEPGAVSTCGQTSCFRPVSGTVSVAVGATTPTDYIAQGPSSSTWVTGPAWGLTLPGGLAPGEFETYGATSWYLPPSLGVASFLGGTQPVVELDYSGGRVTAIYVTFAGVS
jgi:hypothetical protein